MVVLTLVIMGVVLNRAIVVGVVTVLHVHIVGVIVAVVVEGVWVVVILAVVLVVRGMASIMVAVVVHLGAPVVHPVIGGNCDTSDGCNSKCVHEK